MVWRYRALIGTILLVVVACLLPKVRNPAELDSDIEALLIDADPKVAEAAVVRGAPLLKSGKPNLFFERLSDLKAGKNNIRPNWQPDNYFILAAEMIHQIRMDIEAAYEAKHPGLSRKELSDAAEAEFRTMEFWQVVEAHEQVSALKVLKLKGGETYDERKQKLEQLKQGLAMRMDAIRKTANEP